MTEQEWREKFARKLGLMLLDSNCTKKEFAETVGISECTLSNYLHGRRLPSILILKDIADALDCTMDELTTFQRY